MIYDLFLQHSSIILNWLLIFDILISYNVMWSLIQREKWASLSDVFLRARAPHRQSGRTTKTDFITWPGKLSEVILTIIISGGYRKFFSRGSWFSSINHSAFSFHSKFFAELYLAIRSWTMLVVLDLTTTRTGELSDGKSGASFRTWQNCASLLFKWRVMNDCLPFYRLGGLIARNILKDQITNTTILQTYAESPRNKTHMANFEYDLLLGLKHQLIPFNQIELSLAPTWDSYWIDLRNILRKPWFVASNILWGFRFQFSDPIVRCTAHLITPGGELTSTSTKSSIHLCRGFPNRFYPWIQLPNSHRKSTIKLVSYTSYTWLVIYELILAALKYHIKLVTNIRYTD